MDERPVSTGHPPRDAEAAARLLGESLPPGFPDPNQEGFAAEVRRLVHEAESQLEFYNDESSSDQTDLKIQLMLVELTAGVRLGAQNPPRDLASLRARLHQINTVGWGYSRVDAGNAVGEALTQIERCEAWRCVIASWVAYLGRLKRVEATDGPRKGGAGPGRREVNNERKSG